MLLKEQENQMNSLNNPSESSLLKAFNSLLSFLFPKTMPEKEELREENMIPSSVSLAYRMYKFCKKIPKQEFQEKLYKGE